MLYVSAGVFFVALPYALLYGNMTSNISSYFSRLMHGDAKVLPKTSRKVTHLPPSCLHAYFLEAAQSMMHHEVHV